MDFTLAVLGIGTCVAFAGFFSYVVWKLGRNPDLILYNKNERGTKEIYVSRWYLAFNKLFAVFIHEFTARDLDLPHNHIGPMLSLVIGGRGTEELYNILGVKVGERQLKPWRFYLRGTRQPHLIHSSLEAPLTTIVFALIGLNRNWGFYTPNSKFIPAKEHCRTDSFKKTST